MDWNSLSESATALWGFVIALGANAFVSILNFFKVGVSGGKIKKISDFSVLASNTFTFAKKELTSMSNDIKKEIVATVVVPLTDQISGLKEENALLANLAVTALAISPIPLSEKKEMYSALSKISSISAETTKLLGANIKTEEEKKTAEVEENDDLDQLIDEA